MDDSKQQTLAQIQNTDLSATDLQKVLDFQEKGMPNLSKITDDNIARMMNLYLSGKPYTEISRIMKVERDLVLFLSHRFKWFSSRRDYLSELQGNIVNRMVENELRSQDFLLQLTHALQKRIGKQISDYLATDNESHMNEINMKEVVTALKTIESISKRISEPTSKRAATPAVGINLGDGVTIEKNSDNKVTITPKEKTTGNMLREMADFRREQERLKAEETSDIRNKTKGEKNEI